MKKLLISSIAALGLIATPALAADMARKMPIKAPPAPAAAFSWTGFYVGGNAGYGWGNANDQLALGGSWFTDSGVDFLFLDPLMSHQLHPKGFTGGVEAGYNYQTGPWVWGIEADWEYFGLKDSFSGALTGSCCNPYAVSSSFQSNWLVTIRPRVGYAFDHFLVYATGGLAVANQKFSQNITQLNFPFIETGSVSQVTAGWTVGGGAEYAFDNHWSVKAEYLYVDPGSVSFSSAGSCPSPAFAADCNSPPPNSSFTGSHSAELKANIVRGGINYRFW